MNIILIIYTFIVVFYPSKSDLLVTLPLGDMPTAILSSLSIGLPSYKRLKVNQIIHLAPSVNDVTLRSPRPIKRDRRKPACGSLHSI